MNHLLIGKQKFNCDSKEQIAGDLWGKASDIEEKVCFRNNELIHGVLGKKKRVIFTESFFLFSENSDIFSRKKTIW